MAEQVDVAVVILSKDEERNIARAVSSVVPHFAQVFVLDSGSTDRTRELAREHGAQVFENPWPGYAAQRNWAIDHLPITAGWIFFLDADEYVEAPFVAEVREALARAPLSVAGFSIRRTLEWGGAHIVHGGIQDARIIRLLRRGRGRCDARAVNEHIVLDGVEATLETPVAHWNDSGLRRWVDKHLVYARLEASSLLDDLLSAPKEGTGPSARSRHRKRRLYAALPPFWRAAARFGYSMTVQEGYRDGLDAAPYYLLHHLLYPMLTDVHFVAQAAQRLAHRPRKAP
jgi:glycosyltransferase involved in cell wall biosynthesis